MTTQILIPATTAPVVSKPFSGTGNGTVSLVAADLSVGESITVQVYAAAAATPKYINYLTNGTQWQLSATSPVLQLNMDNLSLQLSKPATSNQVGVSLIGEIVINP